MFLCQNCLNRPLPLFQSICHFQNLLRASARFSFLLCYLDRFSKCCRNYDWIVKVWLVVVNSSLASYFFYCWFWGPQHFFYIFSFFFDVVISALQVTWICLICIIFVFDLKNDVNLLMILFVEADCLSLYDVSHNLSTNRCWTDNLKQFFLSLYILC